MNISEREFQFMVEGITSDLIQMLMDREHYSLDSYANPDHLSAFAVHDQAYHYHLESQARRRLARFMETLSEEDRKILEMRNRNCSYRQIASELNSDVKRVDNRLTAVRRSFRSFADSA